jgi:vacuolar protein sorting-associated protein 13B
MNLFFQVSLWGGDVVFNNLDLRLDVLERELGLPFSFLSGHIHELQIHVPWTRLNAEPIVITINTIECVLRLPDGSSRRRSHSRESSEASFKGAAGSEKLKRSLSRKQPEQVEAPPGYVQSLINKIISNVKIVCNNLILKYVEEDIVLSLNTRWLCLTSANAIWEPAFVELSLPDLVLRKLLQIKDMTVCLDKRDASGKIGTYQEPLLYRCSLSVHAAWIYDSLNAKVPRTSRYDFRSSQMDFSLTDTQLPMFLRILHLMLALYYGDIQEQVADAEAQKQQDFAIEMPSDEEFIREDTTDEKASAAALSSWSGWAWNVGSSVGGALLPIYWEDEDEDENLDMAGGQRKSFIPIRDRTVHLGLYVDVASLVFKLTEKLPKDIKSSMSSSVGGGSSLFHSSTRLSFTPFLRLDVSGFFQEIKAIGVHTVNVSGGFSGIDLSPVGDCICGEKDTSVIVVDIQSSDNQETLENKQVPSAGQEEYFSSGDHSRRTFLRGSLFEKDFGDEEGLCKERKCSYNVEWEHHLDTVTEEAMLDRSPAVALDLLYHLELPNDFDSEQLSVISDLENSDLEEKSICRVVVGPSKARICSGSVHRFKILEHHLASYDYLPYKQVESYLNQAESAKTSVIKEVEDFTDDDEDDTSNKVAGKVRIYQLTAINPSLLVYASDHPNLSPQECLLHRRQNRLNINTNQPIKDSFTSQPCCLISIDCLDSQALVPMYPLRLAAAAIESNDPHLTRQSYVTTTIKAIQLASRLIGKLGQVVTWLQPSNVQFGMRTLQGDHLWPRDMVNFDLSVDLQTCKVRMTRPQWLLLQHIATTWLNQSCAGDITKTSLLEDAMTRKLPSIIGSFSGAHLAAFWTKDTLTIQAYCSELAIALGNISAFAIPLVSTSPAEASIMAKSPMPHNSPGRARSHHHHGRSGTSHWLQLELQFPTSRPQKEIRPSVLSLLALNIGEVHINYDPKINDWILYCPSKMSAPVNPVPLAPEQQPPNQYIPACNKSLTLPDGARSKSRSKSPKSEPFKKVNRSFSGKQTTTGTSTVRKPDQVTDQLVVCSDKDQSTEGDISKIYQFLSEWFSTLNSLLVQVQIDPCHIYAPRKSLAFGASKPSKHVRDTITTTNVPVLAAILPCLILENVTHKPMIQQFLAKVPFAMPEGVWNILRDNLPWTLKLKDFSMFSIDMSGEKAFILNPVTTSCTMGLNAKVEGFGLCVHADMTVLKTALTDDQLAQSVSLIDRVVPILVRIYPDLFYVNDLRPGGPQMTCMESGLSMHSVEQSSMPHQSSETSREPLLSGLKSGLKGGDLMNSGLLSIWVQWTLPQSSLSLVTATGQKLHMSIEDCQSSFDWSPVYFQAKGRVLGASIKHYVKAGNAREWTLGCHNGVILTFGNEITHDLEIINAKTNAVESLSHSKHHESDKTCFNMVFTRAECRNVHSKWTELMKNKSFLQHQQFLLKDKKQQPRFLNEIDVKIAPVDIILGMEYMMPFIKMLSRPMQLTIPSITAQAKLPQHQQDIIGIGINNNTLPLAYLKAKTIRVFLIANRGRNDSSEAAFMAPDVILVNCDSLSMTPQVDNMLSRILLKPDLYHLSQPLLDVPGANVEDRQYQIDVLGLGVYSGAWAEIAKKSEKLRKPLVLKSMGENPALEWNIASCNEATNESDEDVILMPMVGKFDLQVTLAPAIVLQHSHLVQELVAGHSIEVNAKSDIMLSASLSQIHLVSLLCQEVIATHNVLLCHPSLVIRGQSIGPSSPTSGPSNHDSGVDFDTFVSRSQPIPIKAEQLVIQEAIVRKFVPIELLITGSKVTLLSYRLSDDGLDHPKGGVKTVTRSSLRKKLQHRNFESRGYDDGGEEESDTSCQPQVKSFNLFEGRVNAESKESDVGYEASEEESCDDHAVASKNKFIVVIHPLIHCTVSQPHLFVKCSSSEQKIEGSCYDASIHLSPSSYFITCSGGHHVPGRQDFPCSLFSTKPGELDKKSGIPPSLVTVSAKNFLVDIAIVEGKIERPIKVNLNLRLAQELNRITGEIGQSCGFEEISHLLGRSQQKQVKETAAAATAAEPLITRIRHQVAGISGVNLSTKQIVFSANPNDNIQNKKANSIELLFGLFGCTASINFKSKFIEHSDIVMQCDVRLRFDRIMSRTSFEGINHKLLGPWNLTSKLECIWVNDDLPHITTTVSSEVLNIEIGPESLLAISATLNTFAKDPIDKAVVDDSSKEDVVDIIVSGAGSGNKCSNEQHYIDDLRAGAFQFVDTGSGANILPKPYQVVFNNKPATMTWKYPQPRTLTRVSVFPVPIMSAEGDDHSANFDADQTVLCALQYWDKCLDTFRTYSQFELSEDNVRYVSFEFLPSRPLISLVLYIHTI